MTTVALWVAFSRRDGAQHVGFCPTVDSVSKSIFLLFAEKFLIKFLNGKGISFPKKRKAREMGCERLEVYF